MKVFVQAGGFKDIAHTIPKYNLSKKYFGEKIWKSNIVHWFWKRCTTCSEHVDSTMRRDLLNNVLHLWAGIFLLNI